MKSWADALRRDDGVVFVRGNYAGLPVTVFKSFKSSWGEIFITVMFHENYYTLPVGWFQPLPKEAEMETTSELKPYWVTKYALSKGVVKVNGYLLRMESRTPGESREYLTNHANYGSQDYFYYSPEEYAESEKEAITQVLGLATKKEESIRRQLDKVVWIRREAEQGRLIYAKGDTSEGRASSKDLTQAGSD